MALGQPETQEPFGHGRQVHPVEAGQPAGELGVVQRGRPHADLGQAGQVLIGGVQDPFVSREHLGDGPQRGQRVRAMADGVDEHRAGAGPPDLNQVGPVGVAETRRSLGVHRERSAPTVQELCGRLDLADGHGDIGNALGGVEQRGGFGFGAAGRSAVGPVGRRFAHVRRVTASPGP